MQREQAAASSTHMSLGGEDPAVGPSGKLAIGCQHGHPLWHLLSGQEHLPLLVAEGGWRAGQDLWAER